MQTTTYTLHGRNVWLGDVLAGRIEPMSGDPLTRWGYLPVPGADVPEEFQRPRYARTVTAIKQSLRRAIRSHAARVSS